MYIHSAWLASFQVGCKSRECCWLAGCAQTNSMLGAAPTLKSAVRSPPGRQGWAGSAALLRCLQPLNTHSTHQPHQHAAAPTHRHLLRLTLTVCCCARCSVATSAPSCSPHSADHIPPCVALRSYSTAAQRVSDEAVPVSATHLSSPSTARTLNQQRLFKHFASLPGRCPRFGQP